MVVSDRLLPRGPVHNTMLTTARRCPQRYVFKYVRGLRPIETALPLRRGLWLHSMLQADALKRGLAKDTLLVVPETIDVHGVGEVELYAPGGEDPLLMVRYEPEEGDKRTATYPLTSGGMLKLLTEHVYEWLPEETKEHITENGLELPEACRRIMRGYLWKYRDVLDREEVLLVEYENATEVDGELYHWRIDELVRTADGVVVLRDWKTTKSLPTGSTWKLIESQLHLYPVTLKPHLDELAKQNATTDMKGRTSVPELEVQAVEFDYLRSRPPLEPSVNKSGKLSRAVRDTDAMTFLSAAKKAGLERTDECYDTNKTNPVSPTVEEKLEELKDNDIFFMRQRLPRSKKVTRRLLEENENTIGLIDSLHERPEDFAYRVTIPSGPYSCENGCEFKDLCVADLYGMDVSTIIGRDFEEWEPEDLHEMDEWLEQTEIED